jgi:nucleotide-binding universal stress UspA family protein
MSAPLSILLPTDDSPAALKAVEHVIALVKAGTAVDVHLLNVQLPVRGAAASLVGQAELNDFHREEGTKALAGARTRLEAAGITPKLHIGVGDPGETIVAFADKLGVQHVVMGTRGFGTAAGFLLGSAAQQVVSEAKWPVTLLHVS